MNYNFENVNVENLENLSDSDLREENVNDENGVTHDDGFMHVTYNHVHYVINPSQEVSSSEYNRQCNEFLRECGITGPRVTGRNK